MELVLNEWFIEYMVPSSGRQRQVWELLDLVEAKRDIIVVRLISPFTGKFYQFSKQWASQRPPLFKRLHLLMRDPSKVRIVNEEEIQPLPEPVLQLVPRKDIYLAELAATTVDKTIVTTDVPLRDRLDGNGGFRVYLVEDFLKWYHLKQA